jgi:uncharacterized protein YjbI with pentapeptide repeats
MTPPTFEITALSPVATAAVLCRLSGALWATVVAKATFQLVHEELARLVAPVELVAEDRVNAQNGSLEHARETVPYLPNAGVIVKAHAYAPDRRAVSSTSVRLGLSRDRTLIDKTLHVFGDRAAWAPGHITPFHRIPIVYERTYGGAGISENPVGVGGPGSTALPSIVDPQDSRKVAGVGPIASHWAPRRALLGAVAPDALKAHVVDVPSGFDWRFFQAAPADQQIERLCGDEWIVLDGMHPALPRIQSRLPQIMAVARRQVSAPAGATVEHLLEMHADMLVIDADRMTACLVWRGRFAAESVEILSRTRVLVGLEQRGRSRAWPSCAPQKSPVPSTETREVDVRAILGKAVPFSTDGESKLPPSPTGVRSRLAFTGTETVDMRPLLPQPVIFAAAAQLTVPSAMSIEARPAASSTTMDALPVAVTVALPFAEAIASRPPLESIATPIAQKPAPMSTGTADINVAQLLKPATPYDTSGRVEVPGAAPLSFISASGAAPSAVSTPASASVHSLPTGSSSASAPVPPLLAQAPPIVPPPPGPPMLAPPPRASSTPAESAAEVARELRRTAAEHRSRVQAKLAQKQHFDGDDLAGANLSGLDLSGCSLVRCNLRGAKLRGTKLSGAKLAHAVLDEADLRGVQLDGADLSDASLIKANLERANLVRCVAERADLRDAHLRRADLAEARFTNACLRGAAMHDVQATEVDLSGARLVGADLTNACFRAARASAAVLASAILDGCDLQNANLQGANLHKASMRRTLLAGANLAEMSDSAPP